MGPQIEGDDNAGFGMGQTQSQLKINQVDLKPNFNCFKSDIVQVSHNAGEVGDRTLMQDMNKNLESISTRYILNFEKPVAVKVQLSEGILDPEKHTAVTFQNSSKIPDYPKSRKDKKN